MGIINHPGRLLSEAGLGPSGAAGNREARARQRAQSSRKADLQSKTTSSRAPRQDVAQAEERSHVVAVGGTKQTRAVRSEQDKREQRAWECPRTLGTRVAIKSRRHFIVSGLRAGVGFRNERSSQRIGRSDQYQRYDGRVPWRSEAENHA